MTLNYMPNAGSRGREYRANEVLKRCRYFRSRF